MRSFRDFPIRAKLTILLVGIVGIALLLACGFFVANDVRQSQAAMADQISVLADVLGANSAAALSFGDAEAARQVLSSLSLEPNVVAACIYDAEDRVFAGYAAPGVEVVFPAAHGGDAKPDFAGGDLQVFRPIVQSGESLGHVYLRTSLSGLHAQFRSNVYTAIIVLAVSLLAATLLAFRWQRVISDPILRLFHATQRVAADSDFSIRVPGAGDDELGILCGAFNSMLAQIQERDVELAEHRAHLEQLVRDRTRHLEAKSAALRESEELLAHINAELARSNSELQQFAYIASHDLQEPLRKVQAFGDILVSRYRDALDAEGQDYLQRMQNAAARMKTLINDLLIYSRVTSKAQPFTTVDLAVVAREVAVDLESRLAETGGQLEFGALPTLEADPTQMRQLLQNLLGNALKYHRSEVPPRVQIDSRLVPNPHGEVLRTATADEVCELTVGDNGIGFEQKYAEQIFAPFVRLHGRNEYEGTGIGLAVCRKIVERHGGSITATGTPGQGATFLVRLPRRQPLAAPGERGASAP